jgi:CBS domain-containing protein
MGIDAKEIGVKDVITIDRGKSVRSASSLMGYFKVDSLLVTDDNYPVGIITMSDIERRKTDMDMVETGEIMSEPLIWTRYNTTLTEVAEIMELEMIKRLPIFGNLSSGPIILGMYVHKAPESREVAPDLN